MKRILAVLFAVCLYVASAQAETSTNTDTLWHTWYSSPVFTDGAFSGTMFRNFEGNSQDAPTLLVQVDMTAGVFDTGIRAYYTAAHVSSIHPKYWVSAIYDVTVTSGTGKWWVGPKINVNFDGWPTDWYENYIVENSNETPGQWDSVLLGLGGTYLGQTYNNGANYKHYYVPWVTWHQLWAVRQSYRSGGAVDVKRIMRFWQTNGAHQMPNHYDVNEIRINVEVSGAMDMEVDIHSVYIPEDYTSEPEPKFTPCIR